MRGDPSFIGNICARRWLATFRIPNICHTLARPQVRGYGQLLFFDFFTPSARRGPDTESDTGI